MLGAVANAGTDIAALIRRTLDALGRTGDTALTVFTDGLLGPARHPGRGRHYGSAQS